MTPVTVQLISYSCKQDTGQACTSGEQQACSDIEFGEQALDLLE